MEKADEADLAWEYEVRTASKDAYTPWQTVTFSDLTIRCWADDGTYSDGKTPKPCFVDSTTDVGLCDRHHEEIVVISNFRAVEETT